MNQDTAVVLAWVLAAALVLALAAAGFAWRAVLQQRSRARELRRELAEQQEAFERELAAREEALAQREAAAQQAAAQAAAAARGETEIAAREVTRAAVRAFGTSVVSIGADVGPVLSGALRVHRDDEVYETLTRIDHSVQQMVRQAQSYVIVCGGLPGRRWPQQTLTDVVGGAIGRVRDFTRVRPTQLDRTVVSRAVEPLVHTVATLLDNALRYSPPTSFVDVAFQEGHHGVTLIIDDAGVRMNAEQLEEARQLLAGERTVDIHQLGPSPRVGIPAVAALARRYGFAVYVDGPNVYGGMRAMVFVPDALLVAGAAGPDTVQVSPIPVSSMVVESPRVSNPVEPVALVQEPIAPAPAPVALVPEPVSIAPEPAAGEPEPDSGTDITPGGLPKRRRRAVAAVPTESALTTGPARPEVVAAWHSGSQRGRAAAIDQPEGMS
ncbi:ATP-binding protein [Nocardia inohanensis]|uniref:ATP-binding protein n=1 Tax=Nocardia inohanensis TaxID=209246 RepID=UPI00082BB000|nr:ATP-binding protein [Nocardia inohanensis]